MSFSPEFLEKHAQITEAMQRMICRALKVALSLPHNPRPVYIPPLPPKKHPIFDPVPR